MLLNTGNQAYSEFTGAACMVQNIGLNSMLPIAGSHGSSYQHLADIEVL